MVLYNAVLILVFYAITGVLSSPLSEYQNVTQSRNQPNKALVRRHPLSPVLDRLTYNAREQYRGYEIPDIFTFNDRDGNRVTLNGDDIFESLRNMLEAQQLRNSARASRLDDVLQPRYFTSSRYRILPQDQTPLDPMPRLLYNLQVFSRVQHFPGPTPEGVWQSGDPDVNFRTIGDLAGRWFGIQYRATADGQWLDIPARPQPRNDPGWNALTDRQRSTQPIPGYAVNTVPPLWRGITTAQEYNARAAYRGANIPDVTLIRGPNGAVPVQVGDIFPPLLRTIEVLRGDRPLDEIPEDERPWALSTAPERDTYNPPHLNSGELARRQITVRRDNDPDDAPSGLADLIRGDIYRFPIAVPIPNIQTPTFAVLNSFGAMMGIIYEESEGVYRLSRESNEVMRLPQFQDTAYDYDNDPGEGGSGGNTFGEMALGQLMPDINTPFDLWGGLQGGSGRRAKTKKRRRISGSSKRSRRGRNPRHGYRTRPVT